MSQMISGGVCAAQGFRAAGLHVGVKTHATWKKDVALIVSDVPCRAAAMFTKNVVKAAPIHVTMDHLAKGSIRDIIANSQGKPAIVMSPPMEKAMKDLRAWMFNTVYSNSIAKAEEGRAQRMIQFLYEYYMEHVEILPGEYLWLMEERGETKERVVCDYIAGMSDRFAIDMFEELFVPKSWKAL